VLFRSHKHGLIRQRTHNDAFDSTMQLRYDRHYLVMTNKSPTRRDRPAMECIRKKVGVMRPFHVHRKSDIIPLRIRI